MLRCERSRRNQHYFNKIYKGGFAGGRLRAAVEANAPNPAGNEKQLQTAVYDAKGPLGVRLFLDAMNKNGEKSG